MQHHQRHPITPADSFPTDPTGLPEATRAGAARARRRRHAEPARRPGGQAARRHHRADARLQRLHPRPHPQGPAGLGDRSSTSPTTATWTPPCTGTGCGWRTSTTASRTRPRRRSRSAASFTYRIQFPDPGLYWYHPHIREDYTQEMGLYGNILVEPAEPDYWPPAHRDVVLTLDDLLLEDGKIAPFSPAETSYAAMGRFGNVLLIGGETDLRLTARAGRGGAAVADQHRQHPRLQRPAARRADEARRRGQRPGGARGVRLRGAAGAVRAGGRRRAVRPARAAGPGAPHPEPDLPARLDHRDRGAGRAVAGRASSRQLRTRTGAGRRAAAARRAGWPRRRTRSSRWSPRWTTPPPCRDRGRSSTPARCTPRSPATSRAAAPSAA